MSEKSTPVTDALFRYVAEHTTPEDPFLAELRREAEAAGIPKIWIAPEQASLMQILLCAAGAREVVEVGTLAGYSAIWMARALPPGGRVRTIEVDPRHAEFAERWIARSDVSERIQVIRGAGLNVLPTLEAGTADVLFLDADRVNYLRYLPECVRVVRPGGLWMVDNAFVDGRITDDSYRDGNAPAMRAFNDRLVRTPGLRSVIVPIGDGLWVAVRE